MRYHFLNYGLFITLIFIGSSVASGQESKAEHDPATVMGLKIRDGVGNQNANRWYGDFEGVEKKSRKPENLTMTKRAGSAILQYRVPFSVLFKYDTSPNNPEHKCYEISKSLNDTYTFLFKLMSMQQYDISAIP